MHRIIVFLAILPILLQSCTAQTTVCSAANEQFYPCGPCVGTCVTPNVVCAQACSVDGGCGCIAGFVRSATAGNACVNATSAACVAQRASG